MGKVVDGVSDALIGPAEIAVMGPKGAVEIGDIGDAAKMEARTEE